MNSTNIETFEGRIDIILRTKHLTRLELLEEAAKILAREVLRERDINHPSLNW